MIDTITDKPMLSLVVVFAVCGLLFAAKAICRIRREERELKAFITHIGQKPKSDKVKEVMKTWLCEKLKKNTDKDWENGELSIGASHLVLRVQSLYRALQDENGAQQLPHLHDLRELTLQDEMSHISTAGLRTIISFLLIVGILGTLYGVHDVIDDKIIDIKKLQPALEPSMAAVFCTVVLLWLRGGYTYLLESYLHKLDKCTITDLMPHLQPESETSQSIHLLNEQKDRLDACTSALQGSARNLEDASKTLEEGMQHYEELSQDVRELLEQTKSIVNTLKSKQEKQEKAQKSLQTTLNNYLPDKIEELTLSAEKLENFNDRAESVKRLFDDICSSTQTSTKRLEEHITLLQELTNTVSNLPEYAGAIQQCESYLNILSERSQSIDEAMHSISTEHDEIAKLSAKVHQSAEAIKDSTYLTTKKLLQISKDSEVDNAFIDRQIKDLQDAQKDLKDRYKELNQVSDKLMDSFEKRTRSITSIK